MMDHPDGLSDLALLQSRYEILGELGRDGPFVVYHGRSLRTGGEVAIKVQTIPHAAGANRGARFGWQAHPMMRLEHPALLGLSAVHHLQGGALALAMELPRLRTLAHAMRDRGPPPPERVERVLRDVAGALAYLHEHGVVHRGVRPESIFLDDRGGGALLAHFAVDAAGRADAGGPEERALAFLAPELRAGAAPADHPSASAQSDLYSLGLVGYAMLAGGADGIPPGEALPPLASRCPDAPAHLRRAIESALERRPARRCRTAAEFVSQLDPAAEPARAPRPLHPSAVLASVQHRAEALGRAALERGVATGRHGLVLAASGVLLVVAALGVLPRGPSPSPEAVASGWVPAAETVEAPAPAEHPRASAAAEAAPVPEPEALPPAAPPRASGPPATRRAGARPSGEPRRGLPPLLGDPLPTGRPVLLGTPVPPGS